jgi:hypothetical protein
MTETRARSRELLDESRCPVFKITYDGVDKLLKSAELCGSKFTRIEIGELGFDFVPDVSEEL